MKEKLFEQTVEYAGSLEVKELNEETGVMGDMYQVKDYVIRIFSKKGRRLMTCTCTQDSRYVNSPVICSHKCAVIIYLSNKEKKAIVEGLKQEIDTFQRNSLAITIPMYQNYLDILFRLYRGERR